MGTKVNRYLNHHWQHARCAIVGCGKSRQIHNVVRKWIKYKLNASVVGWANNQTSVIGPTQDWKCACVVSKGSSIKNVINSCLFKWSIKYDYTTRFSRGGAWEHTTWGSKVRVSCNANWKGKMLISTCATASKKINDHYIGNEWQMQKQSKLNITKKVGATSRTAKERPLAFLKKHVKWLNNESNGQL